MVVKVDTFEQDIAEEIKRKDASLTEISAASNNIGNNPEDTAKKPIPIFLITLVTFFVLGMFGMLGLAYFYFTDSLLPPSAESVVVTPDQIPKATTSLSLLSPTLTTQIGRYVTTVEKKPEGYIIGINSYSPVFSYMIKNELEYIEELANVVSPITAAAKTPAPATPTSPVATTSLVKPTSTTTPTTSTTTKNESASKATSTTSTTTPTVIPEEEVGPYFKDVTIANQNMRVWTSGKQVLVYAFITTEKIAVSGSVEGILALKSAIIR